MATVPGTDRWKQIERLFNEALELSSSERPAFLDQACGNDATLRQEVESLLECSDKTFAFVEKSVGTVAHHAAASPLGAGAIIGAYQISRVLGEGGMGEVYLATRADDSYRQQVAIKVMRSSFQKRHAMLLRFSTERQILANLNHPNIARLLDGGITADGLPYLVMEYVDGIAIDEYCLRNQLPVSERLKLFRSVCAAVEYAHKNLVIHRDIKPGNILVTKEGTPKLLDFGIAKLLDPAADDQRLTKTGDRVMTPEYASPEQVRGEPVTTASDVYSLGVLLYELLAEQQPYHAKTQSSFELARAICEQEPEAPSSVIQKRTGEQKSGLLRKLDRDLDNIVLMAMRKQPTRRYRSVDQFSEDVHFYLEGFPVLARQDSWSYRTSKLLRRHRVAALLSAAFVMAVIVFGVSMAVLARRARVEQARAEQVSAFLQSVFNASDPFQAKGANVTARDILDRGAARIQKELKDQPQAQEKVLQTMAEAYQHLGIYDRAEQLFSQQAEAAKRAEGEESLNVAEALRELGDTQRQRSKYPEAERTLREALQLLQKNARPDDMQVAHAQNDLGIVMQDQGRWSDAEPLFRSAIAISEKYPDQLSETLTMKSNLAGVLGQIGKFSEAESLWREVVDRRRKLLGPNHPQLARSMERMAFMLQREGSDTEAESLLREALALNRRVNGENHLDTFLSEDGLASVLQDRGDWKEAEALYNQAVDAGTRTLGEQTNLAVWISDFASLRESQHDYAAAEQMYRRGLAMTRKLLDPRSVAVARQERRLGTLLAKRGKFEEAESNLQDSVAILREHLGPSHPELAQSLAALGELRHQQAKLPEAEELYRQAVSIDRAGLPSVFPQTATHLAAFAEILAEAGDPKSAEPMAREVLQMWQKLMGDNSWQAIATESELGAILMKLGRRDDAAALLTHSYQVLQERFGIQAEVTRTASQRLTNSHLRSSNDSMIR